VIDVVARNADHRVRTPSVVVVTSSWSGSDGDDTADEPDASHKTRRKLQ
jgi:hypothetical protein